MHGLDFSENPTSLLYSQSKLNQFGQVDESVSHHREDRTGTDKSKCNHNYIQLENSQIYSNNYNYHIN